MMPKFTLVLIVLFAEFITGISAGMGLNPKDQKKIVNALNTDRQEIGKKIGVKFEKLKYDRELEHLLMEAGCDGIWSRSWSRPGKSYTPAGLKLNDVMLKVSDDKDHLRFFIPTATKIGCLKNIVCSGILEPFDTPKELVGKYYETRGICVFDADFAISSKVMKQVENAGIVPTSKYGDLLEIGGPKYHGYPKDAQ